MVVCLFLFIYFFHGHSPATIVFWGLFLFCQIVETWIGLYFFFLLLENLGLPNPALSLKTLIWLIFVPALIK